MAGERILIVDDEHEIRESLAMILEYDGYECLSAPNGSQALERFRSESPELVLLDIRMPGLSGIEVLERLKGLEPSVPVVIISAHGDVPTAVEAIKKGAFDFLEKPLDRDRILLTVRRGLDHRKLSRSNVAFASLGADVTIVGESPAMRRVLQTVERVAASEARVLIMGESGTGKELIARALHTRSPRSTRPFVEVNCAAIPSELIESELFGHEKGSFTGASSRRLGKFELADGGTIFLDEVGDMSLQAQAKVLRVLEEGTLQRVGGDRLIRVDVRTIAATNQNLPKAVEAGTFRGDLYYRLNVVPLELPPLRARGRDIALLARHFLEQFCRGRGSAPLTLTDEAQRALMTYPWPGNVRELRNITERVCILSEGPEVTAQDLALQQASAPAPASSCHTEKTLGEVREASEKAALERCLKKQRWNVSEAARELGIPRSHIYRKMSKYGLKRPSS
jgi:two-component system nitrogen regulation response regulator NtrX